MYDMKNLTATQTGYLKHRLRADGYPVKSVSLGTDSGVITLYVALTDGRNFIGMKDDYHERYCFALAFSDKIIFADTMLSGLERAITYNTCS